MEEKAFPDLKISSYEFLNELGDRSVCPKCNKSRKYYCYNCYVPTSETEGGLPKVKLPLKIDIIKHPNECDGKSTSAHAAVLAPDHVKVYTYPCIPDYPNPDKVVLLFPGPDAITLEELSKRCFVKLKPSNNHDRRHTKDSDSHSENISSMGQRESTVGDGSTDSDSIQSKESQLSRNLGEDIGPHGKRKIEDDSENGDTKRKKVEAVSEEEDVKMTKIKPDTDSEVGSIKKETAEADSEEEFMKRRKMEAPFDTVVLIDSTWNQTRRISSDERLKGLTKVELKTRETKFWRHQKDNPATYLSTVEAVYYLVRDYHNLFVPTAYEGEYDNLLFFFCFMYEKIRKMYDGGKNLKAFKQREDMKRKQSGNKE